MSDLDQIRSELTALAKHLAARRADVLRTWQAAVELDPEADHLLDFVAGTVQRPHPRGCSTPSSGVYRPTIWRREKMPYGPAQERGLHRWQLGYNQRDAIREWGHLHCCALTELEAYERGHAQLPFGVMLFARRAFVR
jgi:hypothetical protein